MDHPPIARRTGTHHGKPPLRHRMEDGEGRWDDRIQLYPENVTGTADGAHRRCACRTLMLFERLRMARSVRERVAVWVAENPTVRLSTLSSPGPPSSGAPFW